MMSVPKNNGPIVDPALCRCCRAIKKCRILTAEYTWMGKKEIYADMVMDCYGILLSHVDDNERDSGVCATCVVRLREAIAFRHQVLQCEELFLQAKLEHHDEEEKDETRLKKFDLELKTEPKDYNSDHNSLDDRDDPCPIYSDDDADDNKPLKKEEPKLDQPAPVKEDELKSEDSLDFHGDSSSDSDEPIKKKMKRKAKESKAKANGAKKKPGKAAKKQKAETGNTETDSSKKGENFNLTHQEDASNVIGREISEPEVHMKIKVETSSETETITEYIDSTEIGTHVVEEPEVQMTIKVETSSETETITETITSTEIGTHVVEEPEVHRTIKVETGSETETITETITSTKIGTNVVEEPEVHMTIKVETSSETETITETIDSTEIGTHVVEEPEVHMTIKVETSSETETITETIDSSEIGTHVVETTVLTPKKPRKLVTHPDGKTGYEMLCEKLELNEDLYFQHYNMSKESFDELFGYLKASLERKERAFSKRFIEARQRLAICLRYLKTGESVRLLGLYHGIGRSTAGQIVLQVSKAIWNILQPIVMPIPTDETWSQCEEGFRNTWNLPNCIGSLGGRHLIAKRAEKESGLKYCSAVFIAIADPFGNLILIDVGNYGKMDEKDIFERTSFYKDFLCDKKLMPEKRLPYTNRYAPQVFVGSVGLPLTTYMLCEYPKLKALKDPTSKSFNERIRAARTVDRAFDMLMSNWSIFQHPMESSLDTSLHMLRAVCCLHNYVRSRHVDLVVKDVVAKKGKKGVVKALVPFRPSNRRATDAALKMRKVFTDCFNFSSDTSLVGKDLSGAEIELSQERS